MDTKFLEHSYKSYDEFEKAFQKFKDENFVAFRKKRSETVEKANAKCVSKIDQDFVYSRVDFICTHFGQPRYRGNGIKPHTKHSATGCGAAFTLKFNYYDKVLQIVKHNMVHNHPTTPQNYSQEYQVKRLTEQQKESLKEILDLNLRNEKLMQTLNTKYKKAYTLKDIRALKYRLKSGRNTDTMEDLMKNLDDLQQHGHVNVVVSSRGSGNVLDMVAFSTFHMVDLFTAYPKVIYVDGTYKNNKSGFPFYQIMVEDGSRRGQAVFYAFVRQETADLLSSMISVFAEFMGETTQQIRHAMTDKDPNIINALKAHMPQVSAMLCAFHVHKAMKAMAEKVQCSKEVRDRLPQLAYVLVTTDDIDTFQKQLKSIQALNSDFYHYLEINWLPNVETWAYYASLNSCLFFNVTNDKCEGENKRLNEILSTNSNLSLAVRQLFNHACTQRQEANISSVVQTNSVQLYRDAKPQLQEFYLSFSTHAVELMIQDHARYPLDVVVVGDDGDYFKCRDACGVEYRVSGRPLTCHCPFFNETTLPCCHVMSVFSFSSDISLSDVFGDTNRWLKSNGESTASSSVPPVQERRLVGPEARHHQVESVLGRVSYLLKHCGSRQFGERLGQVEAMVNAWQSGKK